MNASATSVSFASSAPTMSGGVGGNSVFQIVQEHCPDLPFSAGAVFEHLDAQVGTWQFSTDHGMNWRTIRTDLVNRPGHLGLALDAHARLRVLPFGGTRASGARMVFHTVDRSHGPGNGSYRAYAPDERDGGSRSVTLVLSLGCINGNPPAVKAPRPRNKRALVAKAAELRAAATLGSSAMAMA